MATMQGSRSYITFCKSYLKKVAALIENDKPIVFIVRNAPIKQVVDKQNEKVKLFLDIVKRESESEIHGILKEANGRDFAPIFSGFKWTEIDKAQFTQTRKPHASPPYYGIFDVLDPKEYDITELKKVCNVVKTGHNYTLPLIVTASDIKAVSDFNRKLVSILKHKERSSKVSGGSAGGCGSWDPSKGVDITVSGKTFTNIIGCVPVTTRTVGGKESKADVAFVQNDNNKLIPAAFVSYKMGNDAKAFHQYSGLSEKSSHDIFNHPATIDFYKTIHTKQQNDKNAFRDLAPYRAFPDNWKTSISLKNIVGSAMWGRNWKRDKRGIDNCDFVLQGDVTMTNGGATVTVSYQHMINNSDFVAIDGDYVPAFFGRYTRDRNNKGPRGYNVLNLRLGIFPIGNVLDRGVITSRRKESRIIKV